MLDISASKIVQDSPRQSIDNSSQVGNSPKSSDEQLEMPQMTSLEGPSATKISGIYIVICALLFIGVFLYLFSNKYYKTSQINIAKAKLNQLNEEIASSDLKTVEEQTLKFQSGAANIGKFLATNTNWAEFFDNLEKVVTKDVKFSNFSVNSKNEISMKGQVDSFDSLAKLLQSLANSNNFSDVKLVSSSKSQNTTQGTSEKITFDISAKLKSAKETK